MLLTDSLFVAWFGPAGLLPVLSDLLIRRGYGPVLLLKRCSLQARISSLLGPRFFHTQTDSPTALYRALKEGIPNLPPIASVKLSKDGMSGGYVGTMQRLAVTYETSTRSSGVFPRELVVKRNATIFKNFLASILLRTPREACFYREYAMCPQKDRKPGFEMLPQVYRASASFLTGNYEVIMEYFDSATSCSQVLGNQCWGEVTLAACIERDHGRVLARVFEQAADFHALYWRDHEVLTKFDWLKSADMLRGSGRTRWELGMSGTHSRWHAIKQSIAAKTTKVVWPDRVVQCMERACAATSWEAFQLRMNVSHPTTAFALTHGDFHAGNMLWMHDNSGVRIVDWAEVGVFCPFTELAQFVISNVTVPVRRQHEKALFAAYHARLVAKASKSRANQPVFALEDCWERYKYGGIERWLQMASLMVYIHLVSPQTLPDYGAQYFVDQLDAFLEDHMEEGKVYPLMSSYCLVGW